MSVKKWMLVGGIIVITLLVVTVMVPLALANGPVVNGGLQQYMQSGNTGAGFQMGPAGQWNRMNNSVGRFGRGVDVFQAAGPRGRGQWQGFIDEDGDGVCDNCGTGRGPGFVDNDGDGVCNHAVDGGRGRAFVDEDGDGVCDNCGTGRGPGFIDNDGDGVCDHAGQGGQQGYGPRRGNGQSRGSAPGWMGRWDPAQQQQLTQ